MLYHSRGKWVSLTVRFIDEDDPKKISKPFLASIENQFRKEMKRVCQQGMKGFKYLICCQTKKAVRRDEEFCIALESLPVIFDEACQSFPSSKNFRVYNPFGEPLALKQRDFQINYWFEEQLHDARLSSYQGKIAKVLFA